MKYPCLIPKEFCKTPIKVTITDEGLSEDGAPLIILDDAEFLCNFQDKVKTVYKDKQKIVQANGVCLIPCDILPTSPTISGGYVEIFGVKREIAQGIKARNPDGTVNYTELDVV